MSSDAGQRAAGCSWRRVQGSGRGLLREECAGAGRCPRVSVLLARAPATLPVHIVAETRAAPNTCRAARASIALRHVSLAPLPHVERGIGSAGGCCQAGFRARNLTRTGGSQPGAAAMPRRPPCIRQARALPWPLRCQPRPAQLRSSCRSTSSFRHCKQRPRALKARQAAARGYSKKGSCRRTWCPGSNGCRGKSLEELRCAF